MGYDALSFIVHAKLSRHNSERDERDNQLWKELKEEIEILCEQHAEIGAHTSP